MKYRTHLLGCCLLAFVLSPSTSFSDNSIYKWKDKQGNVHYGDILPEGQSAQKLKIQAYKSHATTPTPQEKVEKLDQQTAQAAKISQGEYEKQLEAKADAARCKTAKDNLYTLQTNARIKIRDKNGFRYLNPSEIKQQIKDAQDAINQSCKK